jgi:hypothetical protein
LVSGRELRKGTLARAALGEADAAIATYRERLAQSPTEAHVVDGVAVVADHGDPRECHLNAVRLWRAEECDAIGTGYALSADGLWREHSWGVRDGHLVETTEPRIKYLGVVMSDARATWFAGWIAPEH